MFCLNVKLCVKPARRSEFLPCIENNQRGTLNKELEPLAVVYTYGEDTKTPDTFHFHEQYKGKEGFEAHQKAEHFAVWEKFASSDPFTEPPRVAFFKEIGDSSGTSSGKGKGKGKGQRPGYCVNVCFTLKEGKMDEFLKVILADQKATRASEPGNLEFVIGEDTSDPNTFHLYEKYKGEAGFQAHLKTPHFEEWDKFVKSEPFVKGPEVLFYHEVPLKAPLKKPKFGKVSSLNPDSKGLNLMLKCVKCEEVEAGAAKMWEAVLGDDTGVVTFRLRDSTHADLCKPGSSLRIQNAKVVMFNGRIRVVADKWSVLKTADEKLDFEPKTAKDISETEFELVGN